MKTAILMVASALLGAGATHLYHRRLIKTLRARVRALRAGRPEPKMETMKKFVWACEINGFAWVWCSYILAWMEKTQIAEELSKVALVEIIAPVGLYAVKALFENLSKHNHWPDGTRRKKKAAQDEDPEEGPDDTGGPGEGAAAG